MTGRAQSTISSYAAVAAGGALGAVARVAIDEAIILSPGSFPWAIFSINIAGSFLLGTSAALLHREKTARLVPFVAIGFLGSFTTFSTFALQVWDLGAQTCGACDAPPIPSAILYAGFSVVFGILAAATGIGLARPHRWRV